MQKVSGRHHLVGVTSYGKDAECSESPVVFMAVNAQLGKWMEENAGELCYANWYDDRFDREIFEKKS